MKPNEASESKFVYPNKLYARTKDSITLDISYAPQTLEAVEYTRTDAFIEKAAKWLEENLSEYCDGEDIEYTPSSTYNVTILQNERMIEDFKKAMKQ